MKKIVAAAVTASALLGVAISPASGAPQGPWALPVEDVSLPGQSASDPQIAAADDGTAVAVWRRPNGVNDIIQLAARPPGGSFSPPASLSAAGQDARDPQIALAPDGTATAVWSRSDGSNEIIQAVTRPPGGPLGNPVNLSAPGRDAFVPQVSTASDGTTTVVWRRFDGADYIVQAATRPPGGSFGAPVDLSAPGQWAKVPQVATAPDGTTTVVWQRLDGADDIIQAATRPPGGSFGAPVNLSAPGQDAEDPQLVTAPDGTTTVVWVRDDGATDRAQAATRPPGGSFGAPVNLSAPADSAEEPQVATAPDGTTTAIWTGFDGGDFLIQAATRPPGGSFGNPGRSVSARSRGPTSNHGGDRWHHDCDLVPRGPGLRSRPDCHPTRRRLLRHAGQPVGDRTERDRSPGSGSS